MKFYIWLYSNWQAYCDGDKTRKPYMETEETLQAYLADLHSMIVTIIQNGEHIGIKASDLQELKKYGIIQS